MNIQNLNPANYDISTATPNSQVEPEAGDFGVVSMARQIKREKQKISSYSH